MTENTLRVLIIDDEPAIRKLLKISMQAYGYELGEAATGQDGLLMAASFRPDIILVDLGLPDMDGKAVVKALREWSETPIIVLTAREQEQEKIAALDVGADDYVTKPFGMGELMARMRVCLRRAGNKEGEPILTCGGLQLNLLEHRVVVEGREVKLTPTEYELLKVMLKYAGRVLTHKQLLKAAIISCVPPNIAISCSGIVHIRIVPTAIIITPMMMPRFKAEYILFFFLAP